MFVGIYILYAILQGILIARYYMKEKDYPVTAVVVMTLLAPVFTVVMIFCGIHYSIKWLVTYNNN